MTAQLESARRVLVIPARRRSTRLPDKLMLRETGKTVLQHTFEAACRARRPEGVVVAVDDEALAREARRFGASVIMTSGDCASGTDRVAEVVRQLPAAEVIVNLQADEPEIGPSAIDRLFDALDDNPTAAMATLATPIRDEALLYDPACVKVVSNAAGAAIYFSRAAVPHVREWDPALLDAEPPLFFQHVGIYAYRRWPLLRFTELPSGRWEQLERLEQLRAIEAGETILVEPIDQPTRGIDTPADYAAFVASFEERRKAG